MRISKKTRTILFRSLLVAFNVLLLSSTFLFCVSIGSLDFYDQLKNRRSGWRGGIHQADAELGWKPIPNATGFQLFTVGPDVPSTFDENGFRIPDANYRPPPPTTRPLFVSLGCSYTFGEGCTAEETFSYHVEKYFRGRVLNAGVQGYGLTQMLLVAETLIPQYKPDYLIVQFSPWLTKRGASHYGSTYYGRLPQPYLTLDDKGRLTIEKPLYRTLLFDYPFAKYFDTPKGLRDKLRFIFEVGVPYGVRDTLHEWRAVRLLRRRYPRLRPDQHNEVNRYVYSRLKMLCDLHHTRMIVIVLGNTPILGDLPDDEYEVPVDQLKGVPIINVEKLLLDRVNNDLAAYRKEYFHWWGSVIKDSHPNPKVHRIIADAIIDVVEKEMRVER